MRDRLRVGLVGGGPWARRVHAPALAAHHDVDFVGVWTRRREAAAEIAAEHDAAAFQSVGALVESVDAVAFAVPPDVQAELAIQAARAGRHVILEKPIAASVARAEELTAAVDSAGVASVVVLIMRYAPETRAWLDEVASTAGWGGGTAHWLSGALLGGDYVGSVWRQRDGALADVGPHTVDLLDAALGPVTDVRAATFSEPGVWHVMLIHQGGAVSTVTMSHHIPVEPSLVELDVFGEHGRLPLTARRTEPLDCYAMLLDEFVAMVRDGSTAHPCDVHRGLHLQRIVERAYKMAVGADTPSVASDL